VLPLATLTANSALVAETRGKRLALRVGLGGRPRPATPYVWRARWRRTAVLNPARELMARLAHPHAGQSQPLSAFDVVSTHSSPISSKRW